MNTCRNCGEDVDDAAKCPNCGRRQYRYAVDDATDTASEFRSDDRSDDFDEVAELLRERIQPTAAPRREPEWTPPREWDHGSTRKSEPLPRMQGTRSAGRGVGCLLFFFLAGFALFWIFLVLGTVSDGGDEAGASILGGIILSVFPVLIILGLIRRFRKDR
ncbi:MAG: zinc ribbon domain-containing protein [Acidimicrobiia bacterium]|nr:zinc ribbon domain-containing protein [Acidimicrobiia bacterium]